MSHTPDSNRPVVDETFVYEIRLAGHLPARWSAWFEGLAMTTEPDGTTRLSGPLVDQAALHGLLKKVRDLGMPLVSVNRVQIDETHPYHSSASWK
jgi:hypothetical protein